MSSDYQDIRSKTRALIKLTRPYNALAMMLAFGIGYFFMPPLFDFVTFISGLLTVLLVHSAWTVHNDIQDLEIDKANKRRSVLTSGQVTLAQAQQSVVILIGLALVISTLSNFRLINLAFIVVMSLLGGLYNKLLSRKPILSILALGLLYTGLPLLFGLQLAQRPLFFEFIIGAAALVAIRMSISIMKDFKDSAGDKQHAKRTFYLVYGRRPVVAISTGIAMVAYPLVMFLVVQLLWGRMAWIPGALVLSTGVGNIVNRLQLLKQSSEKDLTRTFQKSFSLENYFETSLFVCLIISWM